MQGELHHYYYVSNCRFAVGRSLQGGARGNKKSLSLSSSVFHSSETAAMVAASASLQLSTSIPYVCRSCLKRQLLRGPVVRPLGQRRTITQGWLRKTDEAEQAWRAQAEEITAGRKESMLSVLEKRGYVHAIAGCARHYPQHWRRLVDTDRLQEKG